MRVNQFRGPNGGSPCCPFAIIALQTADRAAAVDVTTKPQTDLLRSRHFRWVNCILTQAICSLLEDPMNKLILPFAIFVSVLLTGKIAEHYGLEGSWKIGLLCLVAAAVQIAVTRFQRYQRQKAQL